MLNPREPVFNDFSHTARGSPVVNTGRDIAQHIIDGRNPRHKANRHQRRLPSALVA